MNVTIGKTTIDRIMGFNRENTTNGNSESLIDISCLNDLRIMNICFKHKRTQEITLYATGCQSIID